MTTDSLKAFHIFRDGGSVSVLIDGEQCHINFMALTAQGWYIKVDGDETPYYAPLDGNTFVVHRKG